MEIQNPGVCASFERVLHCVPHEVTSWDARGVMDVESYLCPITWCFSAFYF